MIFIHKYPWRIYLFFILMAYNPKILGKSLKVKKKIINKQNIINKNINTNVAHETSSVDKQKKNNIFTNIINWIKNLIKSIIEILKNLWKNIQLLGSKIWGKKPINELENTKERILAKMVTVQWVKGDLVNKTHDVNGILMAKERIAISIPSKMENLNMIYVLPEHITWVKAGTKLVEFDTKQISINYEKNKEEIKNLEEIHSKEKELYEKGGLSQKELLDVQSRLQKILSEQALLEEQLSHKVIKAPIDGYVSRPEKNETGQNARIKRGDLFLIHNPKILLMEAFINSNLYNEIGLNQEVNIEVFQKDIILLKGKIINKEQFSENNTGLFKILINIPVDNINNFIGQPAQAHIKTEKQMYLTKIPEKSTFFDNGQMAVFLMIDNHAVKRPVYIEKIENQWVFVSGLPEECDIITDEANILNNGDLVMDNKIHNKK